MKFKLIILLAAIFFYSSTVFGGEKEVDTLITRPVQVSFISPMGTNGLESGKVSNHLSINIIAGYAGGLYGVELGGFANTIRYDMTGIQFAGFGNAVGGEAFGTQFAGFYNLNAKSTKGLQASGFINVSGGDLTGGQAAGYINVVGGSVTGAQVSGFVNVAVGNLTGGQVSGFVNVAVSDAKAYQVAGFCNVVAGDLTGIQISGFANFAKKVNGSQIGFINIADTIENGIAIGFLSIVRNGYRAIEITGNESFYAMINFKTGTKQFYNIFSVGASIKADRIYWGHGYGFGIEFSLSDRLAMQIDAISFHISEDEFWTSELNLLEKLNLNISADISDHVTLFGGASLNAAISQVRNADNELVGSGIVPWNIWENKSNVTNVQLYPGFNVGIRITN